MSKPQFIQGFMNEDECRKLQEWAKRYESVVEVGSWKGLSTVAMAVAAPDTKIYAVDNFKGSSEEWDGTYAPGVSVFEEFKKNTEDFPNIEVLKMDSIEAAKKFEPKSVDMVFLDADHDKEHVLSDLKAWLPIAKKWICGHDLYFGGVKQALDEMGIKYKSVGFNFPYCLWYSEVAA